ncbi:MAG: DUF6348 family protein [Chthoniobacter sp.]|uniref:DUF6348 family protein n=1 Tax=Chthoniobacter sp. TaxID=2510640 RepID=UPI0032A847CC
MIKSLKTSSPSRKRRRASLQFLAVLLLFGSVGCKPVPPSSAQASSSASQTLAQAVASPAPAGRSETETFFADWLKAHGEKAVVVDARGVGLKGNETRLKASTYGVNPTKAGTLSVEMEFRVALPGGGEIVEFLAGVGEDETKARKDCLANFILTTFHVIYKSFMNAADPHQEIETMAIDGQDRAVARGNLYVRGQSGLDDAQMKAINEGIRDLLRQQHFDGRPHWVKIVYGQMKSQPMTVATTRDNHDDDALTAAVVKQIAWPARDEFYMAKQFIVIQ